MKVEIINGLDDRAYLLIGPYAMDWSFIHENGNPITTSAKHTWYVLFSREDELIGFCSVRYSDTSKNMRIGSLFILSGGKPAFNKLVKSIIEDMAVEKEMSLTAYANHETKGWFGELGFEVEKEGVNWCNMRYNDGARSRKKTA